MATTIKVLVIGGGGGGGGAGSIANGNGDSGKDGIVIMSYPTGVLTATGGAITTSGGRTIHTFTSSGTWTLTPPSSGDLIMFFG